MSEENIALRLKFLIDNLGLTSSQFADKCDISRPTLSQLLSGRNKKISNLIIEQIHKAYPRLSVIWFLFGEGEMWSSSSDMIKDSLNASSVETTLDAPVHPSLGESIDVEIGVSEEQIKVTNQNPHKNHYENLESCTKDRMLSEYSKENGVNGTQKSAINSNNEIVKTCMSNTEILSQLREIKEKTRKVVQITVYYDDSTFQTFYPNN